MSIPELGLLLAGFVLAHAAWSASDLPEGELLVPLAIVERGGTRELMRFEAETQEEAIKQGKASMAGLTGTVDAWAFARDGLMTEAGRKVDVITIDFWAKGMEEPVSVIQRYEPFAAKGRFRVIGQLEIVIRDAVQESQVAEQYISRIRAGVSQHPKAASLWPSWESE